MDTRGWKVLMVLLVALLVGTFTFAVVGCADEEGDTAETTEDEGTAETAEDGEAEGEAEGEAGEPQQLVMNIDTEPPSLDPNLATDTTSVLVINNIFEGLVHIDYDGETFPGAAESWEASDDGLTYTFHLRGTDTWTNGDPVTSQDFKNSWTRILDPETAGDYAYMLYVIEGAEAFNAGEGSAEDLGIETPDDDTLVVHLTDAAPWFVSMTAHQAFFPIHQATVDEHGDSWTEPENIVTNGPFSLAEWNHDADILLERNDEWREVDTVALDSIKMLMITESTTGVAAFENGEIDIQKNLPTADMPRLKELPEYENYPLLGIYYYGFNVEHPPLDDVNVRKALSLAIDRQSIIDNVAQADQLPATGVVPDGMPGFDVLEQDYVQATAQLEEANALLEEAGYPDGEGLPEITIHYNTDEGHQAIATAVQSQWQEIGVNATLQNMEWAQYLDFVQNNDDVMVYRLGWVADFADAYNFLDLFRGGGGNNFTRWSNEEFDDLLGEALGTEDEEERLTLYERMEEIISVEDMPVAPIYWYTNPELVKEYVQGYEPNPLGELTNLWTVSIEE